MLRGWPNNGVLHSFLIIIECRKLTIQEFYLDTLTLLQAADFERELLTANITYLTDNSDVRVVILENQDYRFMLMHGTLQSVMSLAQPQTIVFAHQEVMLRPLAELAAGSCVLELGLGGGSAVRYAKHYNYALNWTSVEHNSEVVNLFWDYFDPASLAPHTQLQHQIELADSHTYLTQLPTTRKFELILCDVYDELGYGLLSLCADRLSAGGMLVVNWLPHIQPQGAESDSFFSTLAERMHLDHEVITVPGFANQIHRLQRRSTKPAQCESADSSVQGVL